MKNDNGLSLDDFLKNYDKDRYEKPSLTTDTVIFTLNDKETGNSRKRPEKELQILLVKRKDHPYIGQWALPGGFVQIDEGLLVSAQRELEEETNVQDVYLEQLYTWGDVVNRDPRMRIVSVSYMALIDKGTQKVIANDDAEDAKWFSIKKEELSKSINESIDKSETQTLKLDIKYTLTSADGEVVEYIIIKKLERKNATQKREVVCHSENGLAFDHFNIIDYAIERLANKLDYTPIVFNLMPEKFTLTDLQSAYEVIQGKPLYKANFRRKIFHMVEDANETEQHKQYNPAKLFRYQFNWDSWE